MIFTLIFYIRFDFDHLELVFMEFVCGFLANFADSCIDDTAIKNGFYGAPTVVAIFCQKGFEFRIADAFCMAENMILQATELDISSCIISRGEETFASDEGQKLLREWNVPENYSAVCFVILGYIDGEQPHTKPRKANRVKIIE